jgi:hypothetical protein
LRIDNHIWFSCSGVAECLAHPCSSLFFLNLWRDSSGFRYFLLYGFQHCYAVSCGLVPACGFVVVWRSSRSLHGFGDFSSKLGRIQPLSSIKNLPADWSILSCYDTYCREYRAFPRTFLASCNGPYHVVIRAIVVTIGLWLLPTLPPFIIYYIILFMSYSPLKIHTKNPIAILLVLLLCVHSIHHVASHRLCSSAVLLFNFYPHPS